MNSLERRLFVLEDDGGCQADRLADAVVLLILKRGDEVDPAIVDEAKHLLDERPWHNGMPAPLTVRTTSSSRSPARLHRAGRRVRSRTRSVSSASASSPRDCA